MKKWKPLFGLFGHTYCSVFPIRLLNFMTTNWNNEDIHNDKCIWISAFGYRLLFIQSYLFEHFKGGIHFEGFSILCVLNVLVYDNPMRLRWIHHAVAERYINRFETTVNSRVYRNASRFGILTKIRLYSVTFSLKCSLFLNFINMDIKWNRFTHLQR